MITPEPSQAYLEELAQSIRATDELDYDQLVKLLFAIIDQFCAQVEEVVCARTPEPFHAVGAWYRNFTQTTDDEVRELLDRAAHERRVRRVRGHNHAAQVVGLP